MEVDEFNKCLTHLFLYDMGFIKLIDSVQGKRYNWVKNETRKIVTRELVARGERDKRFKEDFSPVQKYYSRNPLNNLWNICDI